MKDLVSVIVPIYNIEKYLEKCVNSIVNQTYKNIEILLIDDGSTDKSKDLCDQYGKLTKRVKVFHKVNGGLSDARNYGLSKATGKYVLFIDGDDFIESTMIEDLVTCMESNKCDMVISKFTRDYENGLMVKDDLNKQEGLVDKIEALKNGYLTCFVAWNKLYKKEIAEKHLFPKGEVYEDICTTSKIIMECNKIYFLDKYHYHYIQRGDSIIHSKFNAKKASDYFNHVKDAYNIKVDGIDDAKEYFYIESLSRLLYNFDKKLDKELYNEMYSELKKFKNKYKNNKYISKRDKIMIGLQMNNLGGVSNLIKKTYRNIKYKK